MIKVNSNTDFNFKFKSKAIFENVNNELIKLNQKLESTDLPLIVSKRIYSITIELLYNVVYHGYKSEDNSIDLDFNITSDSSNIYIKSSNYILHKEVKNFRTTLCDLNELTFAELRKKKSHQIKNGGITEKGGAGLGLIDICMKSDNHINMHFKTIDKQTDWITLTVKIDII